MHRENEANHLAAFPLTDIQKAYLIGRTDAFSLGGIRSHVYAENIRAHTDISRLEKAFNQLIKRHDMLRAIVLEDGTQQILNQVPRYQILAEEKEAKQIREEMRSRQSPSNVWPLFDIRISNDRIHFLFDLLIADGTALNVIFEELSLLYEDEKRNLPKLQITYRDCVLAMESQYIESAKKYWFNRIDTLPDAPELPLHSSAQIGSFVRQKGHLSANEWNALKQRAVNIGVSPAAYLITLYGEAIKTHSRVAHFTLNVLFFNRPHLHLNTDRIVGNFSTTLLLEMDLRGHGQKAQKIQQQLLEDLNHTAFNGIKALNEKNRRQGGTTSISAPITFACALDLGSENRPPHSNQRFKWNGESVPYNHLEIPQVLLDHQVFEEIDGGLGIYWDHRDGYFANDVINRMFQIYIAMLKDDKPRTAATDKKVTHTLPGFSEECLHEAFYKQASKWPDRIAIVTSQESLTYGQLAATSLNLSQRLESLCLKSDDVIVIVMEKGWEQVAAVLGILAAGAAYLPIDPSLPEERIHQIISISGSRAAVLQKPLSFELKMPCFFIERKDKGGVFTCKQQPLDLAYVIFTSGSTGIPKGVMIEHHSALNTIEAVNKKYGIKEDDRCFALTSLSFDLSVFDIFGFLRIGASLYIPGKEEDPTSWLDKIQEHQITIWNSTPSLVQILIDQADLATPRSPTVRIFMMSGDWIPVPLSDKIRKHFRADIYSLGGATEASIWSNDYPILDVDPTWPSIPYGKALANQVMIVLDEDLELRPLWATGMIYIGGNGLARGYLNDSIKTASSFIIHPSTGQRLYRTGDLGRLRDDGNIEFLGREDLQAKVQGYRIELEEIESAIYRYHGIKQTIVRVIGQKSEAKKIAAFFVAANIIEISQLEEHLTRLLPSYMIPHHFLQLENIPLNFNGKVDAKALLSKLSEPAKSPCDYLLPEGPIENKMAEIWASLLHVPNIGRHDNFFFLGGTSFLAFRMVILAQKELGLTLPISALFQKGTIAELAHLDESQEDASFISLKLGGTNKPLFLIHPSGGGVLCYTQLASLVHNRPIYAFQAPGFLDSRAALLSIEAMAKHYIKILLKKQPNGPYFVGGWSLGGIIAYEMACQLQKMGKAIAPVLLIDSPSPYINSKHDEGTLYRLFEEDYGEGLSSFDSKTRESLFKLFIGHMEALSDYRPPTSCIDLTLLKSNSIDHLNVHPDKLSQDWGWSRISNGCVESHSFMATHTSILQLPCVQEIAAKITDIGK